MRIAAIYDIHANLPALDAVIVKIRHEQVDGIVVGGDVLPGPMPLETLERLQDLDVPVQFIYGNGEVAVLEQLAAGTRPRCPNPIASRSAGRPSSSVRNNSDFSRRGPKRSVATCLDWEKCSSATRHIETRMSVSLVRRRRAGFCRFSRDWA